MSEGPVSRIKAVISDLKVSGVQNIPTDALLEYLANVEATPNAQLSAAELERYKARLSVWVEDNKLRPALVIEEFKAVIAAG